MVKINVIARQDPNKFRKPNQVNIFTRNLNKSHHPLIRTREYMEAIS